MHAVPRAGNLPTTEALAWAAPDALSIPHLQAARPFASGVAGKMGYEDFVWFILSEEDKGNDLSLDYWFRCCDLDCDGALRSHEMLVRLGLQAVSAIAC